MDEKRAKKYVKDKQIREKSEDFLSFYNKYYMDKASDTEVTQYTTQAYYESMVQEKKRLLEKGLTVHTEIEAPNYINELERNQQDDTAVVVNEIKAKTNREFFYKGERIYKEKHNEVVRISFLRNEVDGKAECPNCGYIGSVSSFIDGCDSCGSKFEVREFEPKVSAFTVNRDVEKESDLITKVVMAGAIALAASAWLLLFLGFYFQLHLTAQGLDQFIGGSMVLLGAYLMEPMIRFATIFHFVLFFMGTMFVMKYGSSIIDKEKVEAVIDDFSVEDFYQNVEMRMNQIFLAEDVNDVKAFAECDLSEIVANHLDVVDSHMDKLRFLEVAEGEDCYLIKAQAHMRLYRFVNGKILRKTEKVTFDMKYSIYGMPMTAIRAYKCSKCGSTIDVMKGGVCSHCGNSLELEDIGMKLSSIKSEKFKENLALIYIKRTAIAFVAWFAINAIIPCLTVGFYTPVQCVYYLFNTPKVINAYYDKVPQIDVVVEDPSDVLFKNVEKSLSVRGCTYKVKNANEAFETYKDVLKKKGYKVIAIDDNTFEARKNYSYYVYDGYISVEFKLSGDTIKASYNMVTED